MQTEESLKAGLLGPSHLVSLLSHCRRLLSLFLSSLTAVLSSLSTLSVTLTALLVLCHCLQSLFLSSLTAALSSLEPGVCQPETDHSPQKRGFELLSRVAKKPRVAARQPSGAIFFIPSPNDVTLLSLLLAHSLVLSQVCCSKDWSPRLQQAVQHPRLRPGRASLLIYQPISLPLRSSTRFSGPVTLLRWSDRLPQVRLSVQPVLDPSASADGATPGSSPQVNCRAVD